MVLLHEAPSKSTKHPHNPQLILAMRITRARIKDDVFNGPLAADPAPALIAAPEVPVYDDGPDALSVVEVRVAEESGHRFRGRLFDE